MVTTVTLTSCSSMFMLIPRCSCAYYRYRLAQYRWSVILTPVMSVTEYSYQIISSISLIKVVEAEGETFCFECLDMSHEYPEDTEGYNKCLETCLSDPADQ